jgi:hypothetical protein
LSDSSPGSVARYLLVLVVGLAIVAPVAAQAFEIPGPAAVAPPTELPLIPVPTEPQPRPTSPRGPNGEYDPGYLYLPDRAPAGARLPPCPCRPLGRWWVIPTAELGWIEGPQLPPLLRTGGPNGPVSYGGDRLAAPVRVGFGLTTGAWFDRCQTIGVEASFYYLSSGGNGQTIFSDTVPLWLPTRQGAFPLTDPTAGFTGAYQLGLNTRYLTADANYRQNLYCETNTRIDALVGYRYAHLGDGLDLYGKRLGPGGQIVRFRDEVEALNNFHGGQIGVAAEQRFGNWYIAGSQTVAFGSVFTDTSLSGKFRVNGTVVPIGFYARPEVLGSADHAHFAVMPVLKLEAGRQFGDHTRVFVGYQFQYLSHVIRATDVIDPTPNVLAGDPQAAQPLLPGAARRDAATSDVWVQSVNLGFELRY